MKENEGRSMTDIDPKLGPLYANLLRLGIVKYLISYKFKCLLIENNLESVWRSCMCSAQRGRGSAIMDPGLIYYAEEALKAFLENLNTRDIFLKILGEILADFFGFSSESVDFSRVKTSLLDLGYREDAIDGILPKCVEMEADHLHQKSSAPGPRKAEVDEKLCFVLMPFGEEFNSTYKTVKTTVEALELSCKRADEIPGTKPIIEDIMESIQKARVLIADLTGNNPNVFYELGIAHAKDKEVILITQDIRDIPFDVKHLRYIEYEYSMEGGNILREKLQNTLKEVLDGNNK